jgi:hypothetical protein
MKKNILLFTGLLVVFSILLDACKKEKSTTGNEKIIYKTRIVPEQFARKIAERITPGYFTNKSGTSQRIQDDFPIEARPIASLYTVRDEYDTAALYVYTYADSGFVVLSADIMHEPICAYIDRGTLAQYDTVPGPLVEWFSKTVENIQFLREGAYDNTDRAWVAWWNLIQEMDLTTYADAYKIRPDDPPPPNCSENWVNTTVGPLLPTTWGQLCSYNDLCPDLNCNFLCGSSHAPTGCVATAMAQVIRYWQPTNSYAYNYASMPNTFGNGEVQRLMSDAGDDLNMSYGCGASSTTGGMVPIALKGVPMLGVPGFGFSSADRGSYNTGSYMTVQANLNKHWPVFLEGCASRKKVWLFFWENSTCHEWVCDGYRQSQNHCYGLLWFHMNWGWHETWGGNDYNGWFSFNNWYIPGRNINYQYALDFTYNVHP